jgi:hypothetical protein
VRTTTRVSKITSARDTFLYVYLIDAIGIEREVPSDLRYGGKRLLVRPHRIDGLLSSGGNAVVIAIACLCTSSEKEERLR